MARFSDTKQFKGRLLTTLFLGFIVATLLAFGFQGYRSTQATGASSPVTSDPQGLALDYSTYLGGSLKEQIRDVAVDNQGNLYVTGGTASSDFPTTAGSYDTSFNGTFDVFVAKFNPNGGLVWSTYVGGPNYDRAYSIEVDDQGNVYVAGRAGANYPVTSGVLQTTFAGDNDVNGAYGPQDGFITKLLPDGSDVVWSTYFGDGSRSFIRDIDVDSSGLVYLALTDVGSPNPHITSGAFQSSLQGGYDGVVAKISADATQVLWATYLGGSNNDMGTPSIRVAPSGNVYVLGGTSSADIPTTTGVYDRTLDGSNDLHLAKFSATGGFLFGTFLGGSGLEFTETHGMTLDGQENAIIAATTVSADFPTSSGAFQSSYAGGAPGVPGQKTNYPGDAFVAKISKDGSQLLASTYIGGSYGEGVEGVGIDRQGNVFISGATYSLDFPVTRDAFRTINEGNADAFAVKLSADFSQILYSTYLGGSDLDMGRAAIAATNGDFFVVGQTVSRDWPVHSAYQSSLSGQSDGMISKLSQPPPNLPNQSDLPSVTSTDASSNSNQTDALNVADPSIHKVPCH